MSQGDSSANQVQFPDVEKAKVLIAAAERLQTNYNTSAYSTMGFWVLGLGWLITSENARSFLNQNPELIIGSIIFAFANLILYTFASLKVHKSSKAITEKLKDWPYIHGSYEHALMAKNSIYRYCTFMFFIITLVSYVLWNIKGEKVVENTPKSNNFVCKIQNDQTITKNQKYLMAQCSQLGG